MTIGKDTSASIEQVVNRLVEMWRRGQYRHVKGGWRLSSPPRISLQTTKGDVSATVD